MRGSNNGRARSKRPNSGDGHSAYRQTRRRQVAARPMSRAGLQKRVVRAQAKVVDALAKGKRWFEANEEYLKALKALENFESGTI